MSRRPSHTDAGRGSKSSKSKSKYELSDSSSGSENEADDTMDDWLVQDIVVDDDGAFAPDPQHKSSNKKNGNHSVFDQLKGSGPAVSRNALFKNMDVDNDDFSLDALLGTSTSLNTTGASNAALASASSATDHDDFNLDALLDAHNDHSLESFSRLRPQPQQQQRQQQSLDQIQEDYDQLDDDTQLDDDFPPTPGETPLPATADVEKPRRPRTMVSELDSNQEEKKIVFAHQTVDQDEASNDADDTPTNETEKNDDNSSNSNNLSNIANQSEVYAYVYSMQESSAQDGTLFLFARLYVPNTQSPLTTTTPTAEQITTKSCCICVQRVQNNLFVLPRRHRKSRDRSGRGFVIDTSTTLTHADVKAELTQVLSDYGISEHRTRTISKKYCFGRRVSPEAFSTTNKNHNITPRGDDDNDDNDGDDSPSNITSQDISLLDPVNIIPAEAEYIELRYPADQPQLSQHLSGETFSHIFGTQATIQEHFILQYKARGPCWMRFTLPAGTSVQTTPSFSWCDAEITLPSSKDHIAVYVPTKKNDLELPTPLFSAVSLSIKTVLAMNKRNVPQSHIVMVSLQHDSSLSVETSKPLEKQLKHNQHVTTFIAEPPGQRLPYDFDQAQTAFANKLKRQNAKIVIAQSEARLLTLVLHALQQLNPDLLIAHDLHGSVLDLLIARVQAHNLVFQWSKLGRLRVKNIPRHAISGSRSLADQGVGSGRLLVDTQLAAKEFHPSRQFSLDYLAEELLHQTLLVIPPERITDYFVTSKSLLELVHVNMYDCTVQSRLMHHLELIPLTKQLTNLCGNTWDRSLRSIRSQRVEYLLLHQFSDHDFIVPEPISKKPTPFNTVGLDVIVPKQQQQQQNGKRRQTTTTTTKKKKQSVEMHDDVDGDDGNKTTGYDEGVDVTKEEEEHFETNVIADSDNEEEPNNGGISKASIHNNASDVANTNLNDEDDDSNVQHETGKKAKYQGGKVIEPKRGFYNDWVAVLDFNSLYPSIIREYNLCFSTTQHWAVDEDKVDYDSFVPPSNPKGILPDVVRMLIERRRAVRRLIPSAKTNVEKQALHIKQLALKLVANSMYGCLGFASSRFFCRPIAACITHKGRAALTHAQAAAERSGVDIIYGDTDSIMINTHRQAYADAQQIARALKGEINKAYSVLNIDEDGYFKNMLLVRKKKYAALKLQSAEDFTGVGQYEAWQLQNSKRVDSREYLARVMPKIRMYEQQLVLEDVLRNSSLGGGNDSSKLGTFYFKREVKGLDMVRRDWSALCRIASRDVLDLILDDPAGSADVTAAQQQAAARSDKDDIVVDNIRSYLTNLNTQLDDNRMKLEHFVITKQITRSLDQYTADNAKSLPHVRVAQFAAQHGRSVRAGDIVSYVITTSSNATTATTKAASLADRAMAKTDFENFILWKRQHAAEIAAGTLTTDPLGFPVDLTIDLAYYKEHQIFTPVMRLCELVPGASSETFAACLGLDPSRFAAKKTSSEQQRDDADQLTDDDPFERFKQQPLFYITCPRCNVAFPFTGVFSFTPIQQRLRWERLPDAEKHNTSSFGNLSFNIHTAGYVRKLNACSFNKTGFVCPTPGCPGLFDNSHFTSLFAPNSNPSHRQPVPDLATITAVICNSITRAVHDRVSQLEQGLLVYQDRHYVSSSSQQQQQVQLQSGKIIINNIAVETHLEPGQYLSKELQIQGNPPLKTVCKSLDILSYLQYLAFLFNVPAQLATLKHEIAQRTRSFASSPPTSPSSQYNVGPDLAVHIPGASQSGILLPQANGSESASSHHIPLRDRVQVQHQSTADTAQSQLATVFALLQGGPADGSCFWFAAENETALANMTSLLHEDVIQCCAHVYAHIQSLLLHNGYNNINLAQLFSQLKMTNEVPISSL